MIVPPKITLPCDVVDGLWKHIPWRVHNSEIIHWHILKNILMVEHMTVFTAKGLRSSWSSNDFYSFHPLSCTHFFFWKIDRKLNSASIVPWILITKHIFFLHTGSCICPAVYEWRVQSGWLKRVCMSDHSLHSIMLNLFLSFLFVLY